MVGDSSMLESINSYEGHRLISSPQPTISKGAGARHDDPITRPEPADVENDITVAKNLAEQRSAEHASVAQESLDSFAFSNTESPREIDPFSTAGTIFNSRS